MKKWIETDTVSISDKRNANKPKRQVHFMISPYDVPNAVRAIVDVINKFLVFEFRYIPINEERVTRIDDDVKFEVGKNTKRIYKIFLDGSARIDQSSDSQLIESSIDNAEIAIDRFIKLNEKISKNTVKYTGAKYVLHDYKHELAHEV